MQPTGSSLFYQSSRSIPLVVLWFGYIQDLESGEVEQSNPQLPCNYLYRLCLYKLQARDEEQENYIDTGLNSSVVKPTIFVMLNALLSRLTNPVA